MTWLPAAGIEEAKECAVFVLAYGGFRLRKVGSKAEF